MQKKVKQLKIVIVVFASVLMLTLGQSVAVAAINDTTRTSVQPNAVFDAEAFDVDIYFVGTTIVDEVTVDADGTYHIISDDVLSLIRLKLNVSGWTCWGPCATNMSDPRVNVTAGELFQILDGSASVAGSGPTTSGGFDVALAAGDHTVTYLFVGRGETGGLKWASDTVNIRIRKTGGTFNTFKTITVPVAFTATDEADTTDQINVSAAYDDALNGWTRDIDQITPENGITLSYSDLTLEDISTVALYDDLTLTFGGSYNSTGFDDFQYLWTEQLYDVTKGYVFVIDSEGVQLATSATTANIFAGDVLDKPYQNFVGTLVLAEYGRWQRGLTGNAADWDGFLGTTNHTNTSLAGQSFDGALDFVGKIDGSVVWGVDGALHDRTSTTGTTSEVGTTSTVTTTTTEDEGVPGFGALVSLLALGVIAFAIPRFRKEKHT